MKVTSTLFMSAMIRALLAGTKTQTRRAVKEPGWATPHTLRLFDGMPRASDPYKGDRDVPCPYGQRGDLLTVKEAVYLWCERRPNGTTPTGRPKWLYVPMREAPIHYAADGPKPTTDIVSPDTGNVWMWKHKVARFMPRYASRLTLRITEVRVQRLKDICGDDCIAEGAWRVEDKALGRAHEAEAAYMRLWDEINGPGLSAANPWVWAITFEVIRANVDSVIAGARA